MGMATIEMAMQTIRDNMKLTGQAKEDFEKWYPNYIINEIDHIFGIVALEDFEHLPSAMKYGVIVDFFRERLKFSEFYIFMGVYLKMINDPTFTPNEARTAAIEKACEIYNGRK